MRTVSGAADSAEEKEFSESMQTDDATQEPSRKRLRTSADAEDAGIDASPATELDGNERPRLRRSRRLSCLSPAPESPCRRTPGEDTLGSLLSPAEALARRRRTPASGGKKRQSRTPESSSEFKAEKRAQKALELANTESNYVRILDVIVNVAQSEVSELLPPKVVELIFSGLRPIHELHCCIESDLRSLTADWQHEAQVGRVFASRAEQLSQLYPPFVNFFDQVQEEIAKWEKRNPRFKSYLRQCQSRRECLRQSLPELLIRPVQRLPSVKLILADLLKYTTEDNSDHEWLQRALATVKQALEHINEEKRNTELHVALFDVMNDIENFPPFLLSSHRCIVEQVDAVEVGGQSVDGLCRPGALLSLFLLTDYLLVSKKRGGGLSSKSPKPAGLRTPVKQYRHVELLPLNSVSAVYDIVGGDEDPEDRRRLFGIQWRQEAAEPPWTFCFALADESRQKPALLRQICSQIGKVTCCANPADLLLQAPSCELGLELSALFDKQNQLSVKAKRFGKRVTRVLSNRTPRRTLSRAVSHLQDPISFPGSPVLGADAKADSDAAAGGSGDDETEGRLNAAACQLRDHSPEPRTDAEFKKPDRRARPRPSLASSMKRGLESLRHSVAPPKKRSLEASLHRCQATSSSLSLWRKQRGSEMDRSTSSLASLGDQEPGRSYEMSTRPSTTTLANVEPASSAGIQHSASRLSIGGSSAKRIRKHLSSWSLFKGK